MVLKLLLDHKDLYRLFTKKDKWIRLLCFFEPTRCLFKKNNKKSQDIENNNDKVKGFIKYIVKNVFLLLLRWIMDKVEFKRGIVNEENLNFKFKYEYGTWNCKLIYIIINSKLLDQKHQQSFISNV